MITVHKVTFIVLMLVILLTFTLLLVSLADAQGSRCTCTCEPVATPALVIPVTVDAQEWWNEVVR